MHADQIQHAIAVQVDQHRELIVVASVVRARLTVDELAPDLLVQRSADQRRSMPIFLITTRRLLT